MNSQVSIFSFALSTLISVVRSRMWCLLRAAYKHFRTVLFSVVYCSSVLCLVPATGSLIHVNIHLALCITSYIYFFSHVDQSSYYNYRIQCHSLNGQILKLLFLCQLMLVKKNENIE